MLENNCFSLPAQMIPLRGGNLNVLAAFPPKIAATLPFIYIYIYHILKNLNNDGNQKLHLPLGRIIPLILGCFRQFYVVFCHIASFLAPLRRQIVAWMPTFFQTSFRGWRFYKQTQTATLKFPPPDFPPGNFPTTLLLYNCLFPSLVYTPLVSVSNVTIYLSFYHMMITHIEFSIYF